MEWWTLFLDFAVRQVNIVGISDFTARLFFQGPWSRTLNFSEAFTYEVRKIPVRGLAYL